MTKGLVILEGPEIGLLRLRLGCTCQSGTTHRNFIQDPHSAVRYVAMLEPKPRDLERQTAGSAN